MADKWMQVVTKLLSRKHTVEPCTPQSCGLVVSCHGHDGRNPGFLYKGTVKHPKKYEKNSGLVGQNQILIYI